MGGSQGGARGRARGPRGGRGRRGREAWELPGLHWAGYQVRLHGD